MRISSQYACRYRPNQGTTAAEQSYNYSMPYKTSLSMDTDDELYIAESIIAVRNVINKLYHKNKNRFESRQHNSIPE